MIFLGLTVLTEDPNRAEDPVHTAHRSKIRTDSITGPFVEVEKGPVQRQARPFSWYMGSRSDINLFRAFRQERVGRLLPFWVPTWHHDMNLAADGIPANATISIRNINYTRHQFNAVETWRRYLAFIKIGVGIQFIRRVDGAIETPDTEELTLDAALGVSVVRGQWMVSFLTLCRLDQDDIVLHWHSPTVAEATFNIIEIPQEMAPVPV